MLHAFVFASWLFVVVGADAAAAAIFSFSNKRHEKKIILRSLLFLCVLSYIFYSNQVSHLFSMLPFSLHLLPSLPSAITFDVAVFYSTFRCISQRFCSPFMLFLSSSISHPPIFRTLSFSFAYAVCIFAFTAIRSVHITCASFHQLKPSSIYHVLKASGANFLTCTKYYAGAPFIYWHDKRV